MQKFRDYFPIFKEKIYLDYALISPFSKLHKISFLETYYFQEKIGLANSADRFEFGTINFIGFHWALKILLYVLISKRFSFHFINNEEDVLNVIELLKKYKKTGRSADW